MLYSSYFKAQYMYYISRDSSYYFKCIKRSYSYNSLSVALLLFCNITAQKKIFKNIKKAKLKLVEALAYLTYL